jgi:PNKP adenylyltransferase domain, C-terminal region
MKYVGEMPSELNLRQFVIEMREAGLNTTTVRLRKRSLSHKRSLDLREFARGIEALEIPRREPLRRVHECVFGVLALESEPVDPRL